MASERPEAAYAARLLERQDALQAEADRLADRLDLSAMLSRAGRFERLGSSVSGLMVWRDLDLGASCGPPTCALPAWTTATRPGGSLPPSYRGTGATTS